MKPRIVETSRRRHHPPRVCPIAGEADIRNKRLPTPASEEEMIFRATEERLHVTQEEMYYLIQEGSYDEDINSPLIVARWLVTISQV